MTTTRRTACLEPFPLPSQCTTNQLHDAIAHSGRHKMWATMERYVDELDRRKQATSSAECTNPDCLELCCHGECQG